MHNKGNQNKGLPLPFPHRQVSPRLSLTELGFRAGTTILVHRLVDDISTACYLELKCSSVSIDELFLQG